MGAPKNRMLWTGVRAARQAGDALTEAFFDRGDPATVEVDVEDIDRWIEERVIAVIDGEFPDHNVVSEESRPEFAVQPRWIIDPLDGSDNLKNGIPHFAISIAFQGAGSPDIGIVYHVPSDTMYTAVEGEGAYANGRPLSTSDTADVSESVVVTGFDPATMRASDFQHFQSLLAETRGVRRFGSAASELSMVAAGQFDAFFERMLSMWDTAAGTMIVEEAGGKVTRVDLVNDNNEMILASNEELHQDLIVLISSKAKSKQ
ncbi:inositol monophosphatase family protein [Halosimplex pelagicum]|uniref:Inositol monophosphatase n=1 Tax=Halosimplex pelagicum TaxID=869886 RepID=A0A7D5TSE2_9EURY|nr:inositol monophosphatase family protein [Halosimplex pelagicum]QLH80474.1 inositol monophosphatase [Halosimplex pelagicum]